MKLMSRSVVVFAVVFSSIVCASDVDLNFCGPYEECLLSRRGQPAGDDLSKPVYMCVSGFSATTFECTELAQFVHDKNMLASLVRLGGHDSQEVFEKSKWHSWSKTIIEEYQALLELGFENINLVLHSAAAATVINELADDQSLLVKNPPKQICMIDPFLFAKDKFFAPLAYAQKAFDLANVSFNLPSDKTPGEAAHSFMKTSGSVRQLKLLSDAAQKQLPNINIESETKFKIFASDKDPLVTEQSAQAISDQIGTKVDSEMLLFERIDSSLHVPTRLRSRKEEDVSDKDRQNQNFVFGKIIEE